jgi:hypothetical protein
MKRTALAVILLMISIAYASAQQKNNITPVKDNYSIASSSVKTVPAEVRTAFDGKYPGLADGVKWKKSANGNFVALFKAEEKMSEAQFDATGKWLKTRTEYTAGQLPEAVQNAIKEKFDIATVKKCIRVEINALAPYYNIMLLDGDVQKELLASENGVLKAY